MTGISGIGGIVQAVRAHGTTVRGKPSLLAEKITQEQDQARSSEFKAQAALRLKAISPEDPQRSRKAFRIFLEGALADLLGDEAPKDSMFQALIDRVQLAMEADRELTVEMRRVADLLLDR